MKLIASHDGVDVEIEVERHGSAYRVRLGDRWLVADFTEAGPSLRSLRLEDGTQYSLTHHREGSVHEITLAGSKVHVEISDPLAGRRKRGEDAVEAGGIVKALMPGRVVRVLVTAGETVRKGAGLLILEAMKMENEIQAPVDGVVDQIFVASGTTVEGGAELFHITGTSPV